MFEVVCGKIMLGERNKIILFVDCSFTKVIVIKVLRKYPAFIDLKIA